MAESLGKRTNAHTALFIGRAYASATDHPLQRKLTFIFTDYAPNGNQQAVPKSEATNVADSALYMPVKINFDGDGPTGHKGAEPIGPIVAMNVTDEHIVGDAIVWIDEFPAIDSYLMSASAEKDGVQFSWELYFQDSEKDTAGIEWLHGITTAGICVVDNPAYRGRTPLIAIAEGNKMDIDELKKEVSDLSDKLWSMLDALYAALALPGAVDKAAGIEAQFTTVIDSLKGMASKQDELEGASTQLAALTSEVEQLRDFKAQIEATAQRDTVLASRRTQLEAAGIKLDDVTFAERADRLYGMADDIFALYIADMALLSKATSNTPTNEKTIAGLTTPIIPDSQGKSQTKYNIKDLAAAMRSTRKAQEI